MKPEVAWQVRLPRKGDFSNTVWDIAYRPDGKQLIVAVGDRIKVFDVAGGDMQHSLKGHSDYVYAVTYSHDGKIFASGSRDKHVIIWTDKCDGILRYGHAEPIQSLVANPTCQMLVSTTNIDFGLWIPEQKSVKKFKMPSRVLCASWTSDGRFLALGMFAGDIQIRDKEGKEKTRIKRKAPVWCLSWNVPKSNERDVLAVGCWDQTLSFYTMHGEAAAHERQLDYDPCSLCFYDKSEYIIVGGSNKEVNMYTKDGTFLTNVAKCDDWVWSVQPHPKQKMLAFGCNNGEITTVHTLFSTVHGLFQERYAFRDTMTEVIIQHLITEAKVRIKTGDYVKKIAIYRNRLAIQLPDRVLVYETCQSRDPQDMRYRLKQKVLQKLDCNLLVVTSVHLVLCQERRLQLYGFNGVKLREWVLEAVIRYIRVVGGPVGHEGLLVGLKNGSVFKIFVDNPFPVLLVKHKFGIRCLDLSASRKKLAVVDEKSNVFVYDLFTKEVKFQEEGANSAVWNAEMNDMLCYTGNGQLCIKTANFPINKRSLQGFVVGFKGSKIFCLHYLFMQTIDVPQSASLYRYVEQKNFDAAYKVACLGVTDSDWRQLGMRALLNLSLDVARKAFIRIRDVRYLELIHRISVARRNPNHDDNVLIADVLAYQGKFSEAARMYAKHGHPKKALEMFLDLRDWSKAKDIVEHMSLTKTGGMSEGGVSMLNLLIKQAEWLFNQGEYKASADMYWTAKEYGTAIDILGNHKLLDELMKKVQTLTKLQRSHILKAADFFKRHGAYEKARLCYLKVEEPGLILDLLIEYRKWKEAFNLAGDDESLQKRLYKPYAEWLLMNGRFEEAQKAFDKAGAPQDSVRVLTELRSSASNQHKMKDVAYYNFELAIQTLKLVKAQTLSEVSSSDARNLRLFLRYYREAEVVFCFDRVRSFLEDPLCALEPHSVFSCCQFLINTILSPLQPGSRGNRGEFESKNPSLPASQLVPKPSFVSLGSVWYVLGTEARSLGAYKLCRDVYKQLLQMVIPGLWREKVELDALTIGASPFHDSSEVSMSCYRCGFSNPLLAARCGDRCTYCGHPFIRCFISMETLPLVKFQLQPGITHEEAMKLINQEPSLDKLSKLSSGPSSSGSHKDGVDKLSLDEVQENIEEDENEDLFNALLENFDSKSQSAAVDGKYSTVIVDRNVLRNMHKSDVFVVSWPTPVSPNTYYKSVMDDIAVTLCTNCNHFFQQEEFGLNLLKEGHCPFCRKRPGSKSSPNNTE